MVGGETRVSGDSVEDREVDEMGETQIEGGGVSGSPPRQHSIYYIVRFIL